MSRTPRVFLIVAGLLMLGVGIYFGVVPTALTNGMGIELPTGQARTDARAVYGGFQCAAGLFMLWSSRRAALMKSGLVFAGVFALGAVVGRVLGFAIDGVDSRNVIFGAMELVGGLAALWVARQAPSPVVADEAAR